MRTAPVAAFVACCLLLAAPAPAAAAEDAVTRKKVQTYLDLAADLFKAEDYEGALNELRRAEALSDLGVVRFNIARCLEELRRDAEAIQAFQKYIALNDSTPGAPDRQKRAQDTIARLSAALAAQPKESTLGTLEVACSVPGSSVMVLGLMQTPVACPWKSDQVPAGSYDIQTLAPNQQPVLTRAEVAVGRTTAVIAQASRAATEPVPFVASPSPGGTPVPVRFATAREGDDLTLVVDNREELTCKAPCELQLSPGKHLVVVSGAATYKDWINVSRLGGNAKLNRRNNAMLGMGIAGLGVGLGAIVGGFGCWYVWSTTNYPEELGWAGLGLIGGGALVAGVVGGVGMKLKGGNTITMERQRRADVPMFDPKLVSVGAAPTKNGGGMVGATFVF